MNIITAIYVSFMLFCIHAISQPIITSFSPSSASNGETIIISGNNFSTIPSNNIVRFGNVTGNIVSATATSLSVIVPKGASYGQIGVSVNNLTCYSSGYFTPSSSCTNGSISFGNAKDSVFYKANSFVGKDFDGDGKIDMANIFDSLYVKLNTSNIGVFSGAMVKSYNRIGANAIYLSDGDLNGDGKLDIISAIGDTIFILKNESTPSNISFTKKYFIASFFVGKAAIADMDGDGKPDLIMSGNNYGDTVIAVFKNIGSNGNIAFAVEKDFNTSLYGINNFKVGDIDGDSKPDIVVTNQNSNLWVIKNTTTSSVISFASPVQIFMGLGNTLPNGATIGAIIKSDLADLNTDGKADIVVGFSGFNFETFVEGVFVLRNKSTSSNISFDLPKLAGNGFSIFGGDGTTGATFYDFAIADINGNGKPDIVYLISYFNNYISTTITLFQFYTVVNNSTINTISFQDLAQNFVYPANNIQLADMDGDGLPDINCGHGLFFGACLMPVTLTDFSAKPLEKEIDLNWKTATEVNNSHFNVQKSLDGISFINIIKVKAIGNAANSYHFTDNDPNKGINYYRLQSVDKNGSSNYSKVLSVNFINNQTFSIIPNPARDFADIRFNKIVEKATIVVYDIRGKVVLSQSLSGINGFKLNTQSLINGVYEIKVDTANGSFNQKLLISK